MRKLVLLPISILLTCTSLVAVCDDAKIIKPTKGTTEPVIDGQLNEWPKDSFESIAISSAIEGDEKNKVNAKDVQLASTIIADKIYFAIRWEDDSESTTYRTWRWKGTKYRRGKQRDDMLALRFEQSGSYNRSMIADADYTVDVWVWSAGRSNKIGFADDYIHKISTSYIDNAAEYETPSGGIVYIDRTIDSGEQGYKKFKPNLKVLTESSLDSIEIIGESTGSLADVRAKALWIDGYWTLEMVRKLDTGNSDDKAFLSGGKILSQIAIFDKNFEEHKSISEPLMLQIP